MYFSQAAQFSVYLEVEGEYQPREFLLIFSYFELPGTSSDVVDIFSWSVLVHISDPECPEAPAQKYD